MFWVQDYKLGEAHNLLQSKRSCFPKLVAIRSATADIPPYLHMGKLAVGEDLHNERNKEKAVNDIYNHIMNLFTGLQRENCGHKGGSSAQSCSKWPYPMEDKARLAQEIGLQLKQINNWFINQRKRNWHGNPSSSTALKSKRKRCEPWWSFSLIGGHQALVEQVFLEACGGIYNACDAI